MLQPPEDQDKKCLWCNETYTSTFFCNKCYDMLQNEQQNLLRAVDDGLGNREIQFE